MATTYEHSTTTTTSEGIGLDRLYLRSYQGILKIAECILDIVAFICASIWMNWGPYGGGWVQFVTMSAFITTLLLYGFHLFRIIYKLPGPWGFIELIYYVVYSLMMLIAAIVAASRGQYHPSVGATAELIYYVLYSLMMLIAAIVCAARGNWDASVGAAAEFIYYIAFSIMLLIAGIVAAVRWHWDSSVAATTFFTFAATACYVFDTFLMFRSWQQGRTSSSSHTATTTTTTTEQTSYDSKVQY